MFIFPGYVYFQKEDNVIYVTSKLHQNTVKLTDPAIINEFNSLVEYGGCDELSTPLTNFLHEQELLSTESEIHQNIDTIRKLMQDMLLITMMPTEACNFRCPYCYENHEPVSMSRKTLDNILKYLTAQVSHFKHVHISWFGGEPTLRKDVILETAHLIQDLQHSNAFSYSSNMTTNGYLLDSESFKQYYNAGITNYQITLDGWTHDKTRPHVSGNGTLAQILKNLISISKLDPKLYNFRITLRHNILPGDEDYSWYDHLNTLFGNDKRFSVTIRPVGDWGGETVHSLKLLSGNSIDALMAKHINYLNQIGLQCGNERRDYLSQICCAGYPHSLVFRANAKIVKCTLCLDHPKNSIGIVDPDKGVLLDNAANSKWTHSKLNSECLKCSDVLSCLNLQCRRQVVIDGIEHSTCSITQKNLY